MFFLSPFNLRNDVRNTLQYYIDKYLQPNSKVYDIGCGAKPFMSFVEEKQCQYIGVDIPDGFYDASHIDLEGSAYQIPIENSTADALISSQVLEHLERPLEAFDEAARVLKKGGYLFLALPFMCPIHAAPHDFGRYTNYFIWPALESRGFKVIDSKEIGGFWYCIGLFCGLYLQNLNRSFLKSLKVIPALIWLVKSLFYLFHKIEEYLIKAANKDVKRLRSVWTVNYVLVVQKDSIRL